jgi:ParB family chromosome partitioning protein
MYVTRQVAEPAEGRRSPVFDEFGLAVRRKSGDAVTNVGGRLPPTDVETELELEQLLSDHLETRVRVQMGAKKGKVEVEFADIEDLERIYNAMRGATV